jgi:hypothetical protein
MSLYDNAVASFARLPGISAKKAEAHGRYFSVYLLLADALTEAVVSHLRETAAANPEFRMPDVADPVVIVRTVFEFFDGRLKEGDGLQLQLLPADSPQEHPLVKKGEKQECGYGALLNTMNMMLRVPNVVDHSGGAFHTVIFDKRFFFRDIAGMENWLRVRSTYRPATNELSVI